MTGKQLQEIKMNKMFVFIVAFICYIGVGALAFTGNAGIASALAIWGGIFSYLGWFGKDEWFMSNKIVTVEPTKRKKLVLNIFDPSFMSDLGFTVTKDDGEYGAASSDLVRGKTLINWNRSGPSCDYFGNPIKPGAIYLSIKEDGGTRTVFNGYIWTREELEFILKRTA